jgi:20S proteasome alpha/beta subunit
LGFNTPPIAILLFAGVFDDKPWILEIERDGRDTLYDKRLGEFAAIGSGKPWAEAILRPRLKTERHLELGKVFAYRTLKDSIDLAAAGLAEPIRMFTISADKEGTHIDNNELKGLEETCDTWRELEKETVGALLAPNAQGDSEPLQIPEPEA